MAAAKVVNRLVHLSRFPHGPCAVAPPRTVNPVWTREYIFLQLSSLARSRDRYFQIKNKRLLAQDLRTGLRAGLFQ